MSDRFECLEKMMAIWNTSEEADIRALTEQALEHNIHFVDPNHNIIGRDAFVEMVKQVQALIPGAAYTRTSAIDFQNNFCRYHWAIHRSDALVMSGFDVAEINDADKVVKVIGFFGELER
ncbi:MAG: hypothetical protein AAFX09_03655 [Pseudomonadota bacterium]